MPNLKFLNNLQVERDYLEETKEEQPNLIHVL